VDAPSQLHFCFVASVEFRSAWDSLILTFAARWSYLPAIHSFTENIRYSLITEDVRHEDSVPVVGVRAHDSSSDATSGLCR